MRSTLDGGGIASDDAARVSQGPARLADGRGSSRVDRGCELVEDGAVMRRWEREQAFLGLARDTPDETFARGSLAALAVEPTVRITVIPGDLSAQPVPAAQPDEVIPRELILPGGSRLPTAGLPRGTSSGCVAFTTIGSEERWARFHAVGWNGGVDVFLGDEGGRTWDLGPGFAGRVYFLRRSVGWAWAAFDLQRRMVERYAVAGPFRAILGIAHTAGAVLGNLATGWPEPTAGYGTPIAVESRVLLTEDVESWPDEENVGNLALRFGARMDLAFGGPGSRHLAGRGPEKGGSPHRGSGAGRAPEGAETNVKVFISSVIAGFEEHRTAAREAAENLGHTVIVAEDFGASPSSPQQVCLAGVRDADIIVLLLGSGMARRRRRACRRPTRSTARHAGASRCSCSSRRA